jgi:hypothetical protein
VERWLRFISCNNPYKRCLSPVNKESDVRHRQNHEELDGYLRVQDDLALKSASENSSAVELYPPIEPANPTENEDGDIVFEGCYKVPGSDIQPYADNGNVKQSTFQHANNKIRPLCR